jgi:hypothetical protein
MVTLLFATPTYTFSFAWGKNFRVQNNGKVIKDTNHFHFHSHVEIENSFTMWRVG